MKLLRWPFWAVMGAGAATWLILGFTLPYSTSLNDIFNVAATAKFFAILAFLVVYTVAGLRGPAKWWKTNIGTYLMLAAAAGLASTGPVAYAVMFNNGQLNTWWLAWVWIGGHALAATMWASLAFLWVRNPGDGTHARIAELEEENRQLRALLADTTKQ